LRNATKRFYYHWWRHVQKCSSVPDDSGL